MKKMPYVFNAAMALIFCLLIVGCASTPQEEPQDAVSYVDEDPLMTDEADEMQEYTESAHPLRRRSSVYGYEDAPSAGGTEVSPAVVVAPENITLDALKDEAGRMRGEAVYERKNIDMPDEWRAAEEAYTRGEEAYERGTEALKEAQREFTQAIGHYLNMGVESNVVSTARDAAVTIPASNTSTLPAFYRVGSWETTRDCFWTISENPAVYGDPMHWTVLYEANKNLLPDPNDPNLILPDTILTIPSIKGERREGTYNPETGAIEIGALSLNYFSIAYANINR